MGIRKQVEEQEAWRIKARAISSERARMFVDIVQSNNIDPIGEYDEITNRDHFGAVFGLRNGPRALGWVAVHEKELRAGGDYYGSEPAIFITQDAEIYTCREEWFQGTKYVASLSPAPEALVGEEKWDAMARRLGELGAVE